MLSELSVNSIPNFIWIKESFNVVFTCVLSAIFTNLIVTWLRPCERRKEKYIIHQFKFLMDMDSLPYTATVINTSWSFSVISKEKTVWDLETRQERIINAHVNSFFHVCFHDLLKEQESRNGFQLSCWTSSSESSNFKSWFFTFFNTA